MENGQVPRKNLAGKIALVLKRELNANSPHKGALSLSMGVCVGIMPIYGFQILFPMAMTPILRLNWPLAFFGSCVSSPPFIPFLIAAGITIGKLVVPVLPFTIHLAAGVNALAKGGIEWICGKHRACVGRSLWIGVFYPVLVGLTGKKILARLRETKKNDGPAAF